MNYKKIMSILTASIVAVGLCGCTVEKTVSKSLYEEGMEVISLLSELAESEDYINLYTGDSEIKAIIEDIGSKDYSQAENVYEVKISDETLSAMIQTENIKNTSEELQNVLKTRVLSSFMAQINGMAGVEKLAASSVCTMGKTFVNNELTDASVIYIYTFKDAYPVSVTFVSGEDNTVSASGTFILYEEFNCDSAEEIKESFGDIPVTVNEITIK